VNFKEQISVEKRMKKDCWGSEIKYVKNCDPILSELLHKLPIKAIGKWKYWMCVTNWI